MQNLVLHLDGDAFFVACELTRRPGLRGKPVVTGGERGIASAMSYEAKRLGVTRGYPVFKLRKDFPQVTVLGSDFELYEYYSERMYEIVRRYSRVVEEYSIDECFAELEVGPLGPLKVRPLALEIKQTLFRELGMTFSVGVAPTKALAKLCSKRDKPDGFVFVPAERVATELYHMPIDKVWGIGYRSIPLLKAFGVNTVGDFVALDESWLRERFALPFVELHRELSGKSVWSVASGNVSKHLSIQKTRTFWPASGSSEIVFGHLAKNIENAFAYARDLGKSASEVSLFLKTDKFRYRAFNFKLPAQTSAPETVIAHTRTHFYEVFKTNEKYRSTGVTLSVSKASPSGTEGLAFVPDLFGTSTHESNRTLVHQRADALRIKYGHRVLALASTLSARLRGAEARHGEAKARARSQSGESASLSGLTAKYHSAHELGLPFLGEVC